MQRILLSFVCAGLAVLSATAAPKRAVARKSAPVRRSAEVAKPAAPVQTAHRRSPYVGAISCGERLQTYRTPDGKTLTRKVWVQLTEDNADAEAYPASVTKLMTLLLVAEDVRAGKYAYDTRVAATADAYRSEPSWVGIRVDEKMSVRDLCAALMVESANDAAIVLGVHSAGSFGAFVDRMNARAAELGMTRTRYYNPNGLPPNSAKRYPWKNFNVSTARDQMLLARTLVKMPEVLAFTSIKTCDLVKTEDGYRVSVTRMVNDQNRPTAAGSGEIIVKQMCNHNNVMVKDKLKVFNPDGKEAVDGLKTGYIDAGGSSVVLTGTRKGKRAIVVVLGSASSQERDANARRLLEDALGTIAW